MLLYSHGTTGKFFGATIFLLSLSSALTVVIMKLHFSGEHGKQVPAWLRQLVLVWLAKLVGLYQTAERQHRRRQRGNVTNGSYSPERDVDGDVGGCRCPKDVIKDGGGDNGANVLLLDANSVIAAMECENDGGSPYRPRPRLTTAEQQRRFLNEQVCYRYRSPAENLVDPVLVCIDIYR